MNYSLAKQLKEARFPHEWCKDMSEKAPQMCGSTCEEMGCYPTLEELIEACEERGQLLLGCYGKGKYTARVGYFVASTPEQEAAGYPQIASHMAVESPTLIEAVAHLYLQLKKPI